MVDRDISLGDLKGVLEVFIQQLSDHPSKCAFVPDFPFTEPSAEGDIQCVKCQGTGCQLCGSGVVGDFGVRDGESCPIQLRRL